MDKKELKVDYIGARLQLFLENLRYIAQEARV
jgi:hypothetical protein